jgi:hypothetical protein
MEPLTSRGMVLKLSVPLRMTGRVAVVGLLALVLAGCDKCGNRIKLNTPALQHACSYEPSPAQ